MYDVALANKIKGELGQEFYSDDFVINEALVVLSVMLDQLKAGKTILVSDENGESFKINFQSFQIIQQKIKGS